MRVSWAAGVFPGKCSRDDGAPEKRKFSARANNGYGCLKPTMDPKDRERAVWPGQRADDGLAWTVSLLGSGRSTVQPPSRTARLLPVIAFSVPE
jgi:hypothetical protein